MKKQELLEIIDDELLEKLFGFCYGRTSDSYEAQDLCSDIVFALIKAANSEGDIENPYPFMWRIARNVYADFIEKKTRHAGMLCAGDAEEILPFIASSEGDDDDSEEKLESVYRRIAFLTRAYREVMILYYLDGLSTAQIAARQNTSEGAIRQRLFSARQKIKNEVEEMTDTRNKPIALDHIAYDITGTGSPAWGDPRVGFVRQFSKHIVWLCRKKPMSASEIAEELNVPTVYVEEEMDLLTKGENGKYGLLRRTDSGKYAINFVLFDTETFAKAAAVYTEHLPNIGEILADFIEEHKEEYLALPYLNKKVDLNLILWQQVCCMADTLEKNVSRILAEKHFSGIQKPDRPFSVYGRVYDGNGFGYGCDGADAGHICGYPQVYAVNIYGARIKPHFRCGANMSVDSKFQLALRAINGLDVASLSESEMEHAAKAVECGYLYREGDTLYTKILVTESKDRQKPFDITRRLTSGYIDAEAEKVAEEIAAMIRKNVPEYLLGEWKYANALAALPIRDAVVEILIEKGILTPPADGIGAEGCWMSVEK